MRKTALITACLIAVTLLSWNAQADNTQTLTGEFQWADRHKGDLEAVFTATDEAQWDVAFHFVFRGENHVYRGTATGSLMEGELQGRVWNESRNQAYVFRGKAQEGAFEGTHAGIEDGEEEELGTLTLRAQP